ncbi:hypothetical protein [Streptomyces sp. NPDC005303]|uniref:hypothetical protein n=1 Tax=Streptomyces sp. NPDC005303 TaxID=3155713 RepID=UPI0033AFF34D
MRRRRRDQPSEPEIPPSPNAIAITPREVGALIEVMEHAHNCILELSDTDGDTLARASGSELIPSLYARAGFSSIGGRGSIPLLAEEVGLLEAAVINLESYQGNEVALCAGYQLLDDFANRGSGSHPLRYVHGILAFAGDAQDVPAAQQRLP